MGPLDGVREKRCRFVAVDFAQGGERDRKRTRWTSVLRRLRVSHGDRAQITLFCFHGALA